MWKKYNIKNCLFICLLMFALTDKSQSATFTTTDQQLTLARTTFYAALRCSQNYQSRKQLLMDCLSEHAALRSKTKLKKLAKWLAKIDVISINHCNNTEIQMAGKHKLPISDIPSMIFCVRYYQKPFRKNAIITIGQAANNENWKITGANDL